MLMIIFVGAIVIAVINTIWALVRESELSDATDQITELSKQKEVLLNKNEELERELHKESLIANYQGRKKGA